LEELLAPYRERGLFPEFPYGTELTEEELALKKALAALFSVRTDIVPASPNIR
jgi:hypothetical protein